MGLAATTHTATVTTTSTATVVTRRSFGQLIGAFIGSLSKIILSVILLALGVGFFLLTWELAMDAYANVNWFELRYHNAWGYLILIFGWILCLAIVAIPFAIGAAFFHGAYSLWWGKPKLKAGAH